MKDRTFFYKLRDWTKEKISPLMKQLDGYHNIEFLLHISWLIRGKPLLEYQGYTCGLCGKGWKIPFSIPDYQSHGDWWDTWGVCPENKGCCRKWDVEYLLSKFGDVITDVQRIYIKYRMEKYGDVWRKEDMRKLIYEFQDRWDDFWANKPIGESYPEILNLINMSLIIAERIRELND